jgi:hypothetical protein
VVPSGTKSKTDPHGDLTNTGDTIRFLQRQAGFREHRVHALTLKSEQVRPFYSLDLCGLQNLLNFGSVALTLLTSKYGVAKNSTCDCPQELDSISLWLLLYSFSTWRLTLKYDRYGTVRNKSIKISFVWCQWGLRAAISFSTKGVENLDFPAPVCDIFMFRI